MLCPGESKKKKKTNTIMDLNELLPDFDYDFLDESEANSSYCTQIVPCGGAKTVHDTEHAAVSNNEGPNGDGIGAIGNNIAEDAPTMDVSNDEGPNGDDIGAVGNNITEDAPTMVDNTQDVAVAEDIWSTLPVPYTGQTFGTKQEARAFYNSYARRIGFSVRTGTSRLSGPAREQKKVLFVCNKEGHGRMGKEEVPPAESDDSNYEIGESETENNNEGKGNADIDKKKQLDSGRKRKREKMLHTDCKARMVVKMIGDRWHVIYFAPDHNYDLVVKPSLKKFMRSHKGIPREKKEFIALLHGCNLSTGRIMQLMNEFYGSAQLVPYEGKDVGNFHSTIRRTEKYRDIQETLDYFKELEQEDPEFFYKIKLDGEHRVESLFWVDGAARHAYIESYHDCVSFDATHMTNMYDIPFTPFIGINRHGQSFLLGCAFLRDEKTPSYT